MGNYTLRLTKDEFDVLKLIPVPDHAIMADTPGWNKALFSLMRKIYDAVEEAPNEQVEKLYSLKFDESSENFSEFTRPGDVVTTANFHMMHLCLVNGMSKEMLESGLFLTKEISRYDLKKRIKNIIYDIADSIKLDGEDQGCISDEFVPYYPRRR
jgi:hypothetical protein